jgi:peptidoglycan/LPS O-acetylase OafA/YrhL
MFVYFCLGCVVYDYKDSLKKAGVIPFWTFMIAFVIINWLKTTNLLPCELQKILTPLIGIAFVLSLCKWLEQKKWHPLIDLLMLIAYSSYIIYLLHTTFEGFTKAIVHKIPILMDAQNDLMFTLGAVIVVSCGIIVPVFLDRFVLRKYRLTRLLFGYK